MEKILIGGKLSVSPVCLGAMNFGTTTSKENAYAVLDAFVDAGGNFIDTSNNYAHWAGTGDESETLLGEWMKERGNRDKLIIATKVGFDRHGKGAGLKKEQIEYWIDESLRKLQTDSVDLYYAHTDDADTPAEEAIETFNGLVKKGKVRVIGASNFDVWRLQDANNYALANGLQPYQVNQQRFTVLGTRGDAVPKYTFNEFTSRERLRFLAAKNIPLVAYSCLAKGGYEDPSRLPADLLTGKRYDAVKEIAAARGISASAVVVAFLTGLRDKPGMPVVIPLFASSRVDHFMENLRGADVKLSTEEMQLLLS